jgi:hypothetical protein
MFAAKGKRKWQTSVCFLQSGNRKGKIFFLGQQMRNGKRQLLFQQMWPSMLLRY